MSWQIYWLGWYRLPWHHSSYDENYRLYLHTAGVGAFQFCWWSTLPWQ